MVQEYSDGQPMGESATLGRKRPYIWDRDLQSSDRTSQYVDAVPEGGTQSAPAGWECTRPLRGSSTAVEGTV